MFITVITDCISENDKGRQSTRYGAYFPNVNVNFVGVGDSLDETATIEAAGNLIDVLDAATVQHNLDNNTGTRYRGIVFANVAPRGTSMKGVKLEDYRTKNGTPFCYFNYKNILVISSIGGYTLSLVKKFGLTESVELTHIPDIMKFTVEQNLLTEAESKKVEDTQFRSFNYVPLLAYLLSEGHDLPTTNISIDEIPDLGDCVWFTDRWGNVKTTISETEIDKSVTQLDTAFGKLNFYDRLKAIPDKELATYIGSSGIDGNRFLELAVQKGNAAKKLGVKIGDKIFRS